MEIWKRFLMARDDLFKTENETLNTENEKFRIAILTVQDLITEDNSSLTFFSELEKSITKEASGETKSIAIQEKEVMKNKLKKRKFKVPYATKNKEKKIPSEKVSLSSAEEQRNTTLGKSVCGANEEKLCADNSILSSLLNRPSP